MIAVCYPAIRNRSATGENAMDPDHFDQSPRRLASRSRRQTLKALAGGALGALGGRLGVRQAAGRELTSNPSSMPSPSVSATFGLVPHSDLSKLIKPSPATVGVAVSPAIGERATSEPTARVTTFRATR
jgi:hypothetical protein